MPKDIKEPEEKIEKVEETPATPKSKKGSGFKTRFSKDYIVEPKKEK